VGRETKTKRRKNPNPALAALPVGRGTTARKKNSRNRPPAVPLAGLETTRGNPKSSHISPVVVYYITPGILPVNKRGNNTNNGNLFFFSMAYNG
jgi:hypothetical protein